MLSAAFHIPSAFRSFNLVLPSRLTDRVANIVPFLFGGRPTEHPLVLFICRYREGNEPVSALTGNVSFSRLRITSFHF